MKPITAYLRKELLDLSPYTPGEQPNLGARIIKLNTNENPYPPSPNIAKAIENIITNGTLRKYPNYNGRSLRKSIAERFGLDPDQVLITNGSDEALRLLFQAILSPGDQVVAPEPTYSLYPVLTDLLMANILFKRIPLTSDLHFDFHALKKESGKLLAFAHPNAPTGILESKTELKNLILSFDGIVLSDEAYIDFANPNMSLIDEIKNHPNLVVTRTFSKSYSLAGLRVGFLIGEKNFIQYISKLKDSYNVGLLEQEIAQVAFEDDDYFKKNVQLVIEERTRLTNELKVLGFEIPDSSTNFIFCKPKIGLDPEWIYTALKERGILVRYFSKGIAKNYVRISIGSKEENDDLLKELNILLK
jgi:histidinol-phosphate aminotransferase